MNPFAIASMGANVLGNTIMGISQMRMANKIKPVRHDYQESPYAKQQLGMAQQMFNANMPGANRMQDNIFASQANTMNSVSRNAGNSAQALAMAGAAQGQTNEALAGLGAQQANWKMSNMQNLNQALGAMTGEHQNVYKDRMQKYQEDREAKAALRNAAFQNFGNALNSVGQFGMMQQMYPGKGKAQGGSGAGSSSLASGINMSGFGGGQSGFNLDMSKNKFGWLAR